ncbi:histidinol dehydrogenase [Desulfotignum phosphitoxidans]|jgi:histidinol dehydrogenase|uniref:Histidinol dehydrogenase n=1 Tax=Desulfotignum phosphitoxidans DSM 13687 TaxID=1286635 RepID=S0FWA8_9BACT|nr:histidinol dehydrogenase [Desulfotignum phosphitoxidans]EMS79015.1 histidinol dehydrogenase HisD [Desulfotignum phosphitoxidans DSM 13687]
MKLFEYPSADARARVRNIIDRGLGFSKADYDNVQAFIDDVKTRGDEALVAYTNQFDSGAVTQDTLKVTDAEFEHALASVDPLFLDSLKRAIDQLTRFHEKQKQNAWIDTPRNGVIVGQLVRPVGAAGIYVPGAKGGKTPLVSSVLMGGIPAKVAGVSTIALMTPPMENGEVNPHILAAAAKMGITSVFKAGSAWAIAALAYGTRQVPKVNVIVGPGNIYVTLAKKIVAGTVGIDMIAGPSEILIIADHTANPEFVAADLLSQAEHDARASAILVTDSRKLAEQTASVLERQLSALARQDTARQSIDNFGAIMLVPDIETGIDLSNQLAPEHLELMVSAPFDYIDRIQNAGALFLGHYTPEPMGDYIAGPNHVLPTAGTARFSSALSVDHFIKKTSLIHYSRTAFENEAEDVIRLAEIEGLTAHANSVKIRK